MHQLHLARWILGTVFAFLLGAGLVVSAFVEKKGSPAFADLYPGLSTIAAGCGMIAVLKYLNRPAEGHDRAEGDPAQEPADQAARSEN
jgi:hypothetical protein